MFTLGMKLSWMYIFEMCNFVSFKGECYWMKFMNDFISNPAPIIANITITKIKIHCLLSKRLLVLFNLLSKYDCSSNASILVDDFLQTLFINFTGVYLFSDLNFLEIFPPLPSETIRGI